MQVRKLQRLLNELVKKDPSNSYRQVCVDRRLLNSIGEDFTYWRVDDVEERWCVWNPEDHENEIQRKIIVIGNY